ncbi:RxLR effector protein [Phytophthora megakarya]|uniref:RxLR effector protein n=1 Tax=Phytophthora megakarya TaxID=4795 RepID=A0A225V3Q4_9STRA|nr:RxLR effector protein [Phytophthora megakarya]
MRFLLWVLLATLVTLLGSVDSAVTAIENTDETRSIKFVDVTAAEAHNTNIKRSLRSSNQLADDEERALPSIANLLTQAKTALNRGQNKLHNVLLRLYYKWRAVMVKNPMTRYSKPQTANTVLSNGLPKPNVPIGARTT